MGKKTTAGTSDTPQVTALPSVAATNSGLVSSVNCPTCAPPNPSPAAQGNIAGSSQYVYAAGLLAPQFESEAVAREFAQISRGAHQGDQIDVGLLQELMRSPENVYLARHLCWIYTVGGLATFQLVPQDGAQITQFLDVLSPEESDGIVHVVVGSSVPFPINSQCGALGLPTVQAAQVLAFPLDEFVAALPVDETTSSKDSAARKAKPDRSEFDAAARRLFMRLTRRAGYRGVSDEDRALTYLACRYSELYQAVWQAQRDGKTLVAVDAQHSHSPDGRLVSVRLVFRQPRTDITEQYEAVVEVGDVFPYMVRGLQAVFH